MRRNIDMINDRLSTSIIRYTVPIILTGLLQLLFNAADLVIVGRFCGSICVAAVSATGAITNLIVNLFIGLSVGASVTVAHSLGGRNDEETHRTVHTAFATALTGGVILTIIGVVFSRTFLIWMNTPDNVLPLSTVYMRIYLGGIIFSMIYNFCASILRASGDSKTPLVYLTVSGVINVVLNVIFVTVFHMNVDGVALATTLSQGVAAVLVTRALMKRTDACRLILKKVRFYKKQLLKIIRIGLPAGIQGSMFSISNVIIQSSVNSFNSDAIMSGNGAASNLEGFVFVVMNSLHQTAVNYIGQNAGAHRFDRIKKIYVTCLGYVAIAGAAASLSILLFGRQLLSVYITDSQEAIDYGLVRLTYVMLPYFLCGLMDVSTGALRGLGSSFVPMVITVLGVCGIRIAWIYTIFQIPQYHTPECLYLSYFISWATTFIVQTVAFTIVYKKKASADRLWLSQQNTRRVL